MKLFRTHRKSLRPGLTGLTRADLTRTDLTRRAAIEALEGRRLLAAGDFDPTFGTGGTVRTLLPTNPAAVTTVASVDTRGGKTVVAADRSTPDGPFVVRYDSAGRIDRTFDGDGVRNGFPAIGRVTDVFIQSDGKVLVTGSDALVRLNANGSVDTGFGSAGVVRFSFSNAVAVREAPGGKIVVGGFNNVGDGAFAAARLRS